MGYLLERLDDLIADEISPHALADDPPTYGQIQGWYDLTLTELANAVIRFRKFLHGDSTIKEKRVYIQNQQLFLVRISDDLDGYEVHIKELRLTDQLTDTILTFYQHIIEEIEELLEGLRLSYRDYYNFEVNVSRCCKRQVQEKIKAALAEWSDDAGLGNDEKLMELIFEPLERLGIDTERFCFRELEYLQLFYTEVGKGLKGGGENQVEKTLQLLLSLNFNSVLFFEYYARRVSEQAGSVDGMHARIDYYLVQIKVLNQLAVKPGCIYQSSQSDLKDMLVYWLSEDVGYLSKKQQLSLALPVKSQNDSPDLRPLNLKKVHVQLTVADLALFAKLLLETEVVVNMNYTELIKLVAKGFRTNRQANISQQAIYNVGFDVSVVSREKVKGLLMKMVRRVGEM